MRTKRLIWKQIFGSAHVIDKETIEHKLDEAIGLLAQSKLNDKDVHELRQYFNDSLSNLSAYQSYLNDHPAETNERVGAGAENFDIVIAPNNRSNAGNRKSRKGFPYFIRIIISILIIALGFTMIVLPAPPYFEMYTIFYFTEEDGFTLMDLISLIVVFSGIFTLIMAMQKDKIPGRD